MAKTPSAPANMSILGTRRRFFEATRTPAPAALGFGGRFPAVVITDGTAPSVPSNLVATAASSSQIDLTWTASTDTGGSGLSGYRIYRDGAITPIGTSATASYSDTGLSASTQYSYRVSAFDGAGNESGQSTAKAATTLSTVFPLTVSGRQLLNVQGTPFFVVGDTPWCLITQLTDGQVAQYLDDRVARGFNTIICELIERYFSTSAPNMITGVAPFNTSGDFRTPNDVYFDRAVTIISAAASRGILVFMTPAYLGFGGGQEGWWSQVNARTTTECQTFGAYVGTKFAGLPNVIWAMGGDYYTSATLSRTQAIVAGIKSTDRVDRLFTYHSNPGDSSVDAVGSETWLSIVATYQQSAASLVADLELDYGRSTVRPFLLFESNYEQENSSTRQELRAQAYWAALTGAIGSCFGNNPIWHFDCPRPVFPYSGTWQSNLASNGSVDRTTMKDFFTSFAAQSLVPDRTGTVLTAGAGTGSDRAYAARMGDGSKIVVYTPSQKALTINLAQLVGASSTASWFNPQTGATTSAGAFGVTGTQAFTPPTSGDSVLVIDAVAGGLAFYDNFRSRSTGVVTIASPWSALGYASVNPATSPGSVTLKDRTYYTGASMLADANMPAAQNRFLNCIEDGNEAEAILFWRPSSVGLTTREVYISWWEYRPSGSRDAGEKFLKVNTFTSGGVSGHEPILYRGQNGVMGWIENHSGDGNVNDFGDLGIGTVPWDGSLTHWEVRIKLSTALNSDGILQVWKDGVLVGNSTGIKNNLTSTAANWNVGQICLGGWNSGNHGWESWPIERAFAAWRVATTRQGVWSIT